MVLLLWVVVLVVGVALIVWGAENFAEHLSAAAARLGVGAFALALLLAGAEPEELATVVAASVRDAPGIAFGDIIGSNIAIWLVALPVGALVLGSLVFTRQVLMYSLAALPVSLLSVFLIWDGNLVRLEGLLLVGLYVLYVSAIWLFERKPPSLGEVGELAEAQEVAQSGTVRSRVGMELGLVLAGFVAMAVGSILLVEAVRQITEVESTQTRLGLTIVGFATAFELVMFVWSASRRGDTDVALAGVVGSFGYNMTMSLGAGALIRPFAVTDASRLHGPSLFMLAAFGFVIGSSILTGRMGRFTGIAMLCAYPAFVVAVFV